MFINMTGLAVGVMDRAEGAGEAGHGHSEDKRQSLMPSPILGKRLDLSRVGQR